MLECTSGGKRCSRYLSESADVSSETEESTAEETTTAADPEKDLITVTVADENGANSVYYGLKGLSLSEIIKKLGITLEKGEKLSEDLKDIINKTLKVDIFRLHTVNVTSDWITVEVRAAGTVEDALKEAGVVMEEGDTLNVDIKERLSDGLNILVFRAATEEEEQVAQIETPAMFDTREEEEYDYSYYEAQAAAEREAAEAAAAERAAAEEAAAQEAARKAEEAKAAAEAASKAAEEEAARQAAEEEAARKAAEEARIAAEEAAEAAAAQEVETEIEYEEGPGGTVKITHYSDGRPDDEELIEEGN